jgi:hypothetical protein
MTESEANNGATRVTPTVPFWKQLLLGNLNAVDIAMCVASLVVIPTIGILGIRGQYSGWIHEVKLIANGKAIVTRYNIFGTPVPQEIPQVMIMRTEVKKCHALIFCAIEYRFHAH